MKKFYFILLAVLETWVEYCSQFFGDFLHNEFLQKTRLVFTANCTVVAPSGFGERRA